MSLTSPTVPALQPMIGGSFFQGLTDQLNAKRQAASDINFYGGVASGGPNVNGTPSYSNVPSSAGFTSGGFGGAKGFAGSPPTTGGIGVSSGSGFAAGTTPNAPSLGDFAVLPLFAIGAVFLLFWLKRR